MFWKEENWEKISPDDELENARKDAIKDIAKTKDLEGLLALRYRYDMMQRKLYLGRKAQVRLKQIFNKAVITHLYVLSVATLTIIIGITLFVLMVWEAMIVLETQDVSKKTEASILAAVFGGFGVADVLVLMKFVMNRAQGALSDMIQTMIAYISFRQQIDSLLEWRQQKEMNGKTPSLDEVIKINEDVRKASEASMRNIQLYVGEKKTPEDKTEPKKKK